MTTATLARTRNVLTVSIPRGTEDEMQAALSAADAWIAEHAPLGAEPIACLNQGEVITWLFPAAA